MNGDLFKIVVYVRKRQFLLGHAIIYTHIYHLTKCIPRPIPHRKQENKKKHQQSSRHCFGSSTRGGGVGDDFGDFVAVGSKTLSALVMELKPGDFPGLDMLTPLEIFTSSGTSKPLTKVAVAWTSPRQ